MIDIFSFIQFTGVSVSQNHTGHCPKQSLFLTLFPFAHLHLYSQSPDTF